MFSSQQHTFYNTTNWFVMAYFKFNFFPNKMSKNNLNMANIVKFDKL